MAEDDDAVDDEVRRWWDDATDEERRDVRGRAEEISKETGASEADAIRQAILELLQQQQEARSQAVEAQADADQADTDAEQQRREVALADERMLKEYVEELLELFTEAEIHPEVAASMIRIQMPVIEDSYRQHFPASFCLERMRIADLKNANKGLPHVGFYHKLDPPDEPLGPG